MWIQDTVLKQQLATTLPGSSHVFAFRVQESTWVGLVAQTSCLQLCRKLRPAPYAIETSSFQNATIYKASLYIPYPAAALACALTLGVKCSDRGPMRANCSWNAYFIVLPLKPSLLGIAPFAAQHQHPLHRRKFF